MNTTPSQGIGAVRLVSEVWETEFMMNALPDQIPAVQLDRTAAMLLDDNLSASFVIPKRLRQREKGRRT